MGTGSLVVVGAGIQPIAHATLEMQTQIEKADKVLFFVADALTANWVKTLNPTSEPLPFHTDGRPRRETFEEIVEQILSRVRKGLKVCTVIFGHPGIAFPPAHEAIRWARSEGFEARMLPGISALDCLFADLGVDPARHGCQCFDATDFLVRAHKPDTSCALILWQIGMVGDVGLREPESHNRRGVCTLVEVLNRRYGPEHETIVYEASLHALFEPVIQRVPLGRVPKAKITGRSTLYVPPAYRAPLRSRMLDRLGVSFSDLTDDENAG